MDLKKILIILIIILVLAVSGLVVYNFFIKDVTPVSDTKEETTPTPTALNNQGSSKIKTISQEPVLGVTIDDNRVKYYLASNGNVFESNLDGSQTENISTADLKELVMVLWSPSKEKVISFFVKNSQVEKSLYDYTTRSSKPLDNNIRSLSWSKSEDKIAYQYYNEENGQNNISIANPDGSNWTNLISTRMQDLVIGWPEPETISLMVRASGLAQGVLYTVDRAGNSLKKVIEETYGLTILWSPRGDKILFSETNSKGADLKLKLLDLDSGSIKGLKLTTLPEKCVWSQDNRTVFCAIPRSIPSKAVLPDDYWKRKIAFSDDLWQINTESGEAEQIFSFTGLSSVYNIKKILISPNEDYLVFTNYDDSLHSLPL